MYTIDQYVLLEITNT